MLAVKGREIEMMKGMKLWGKRSKKKKWVPKILSEELAVRDLEREMGFEKTKMANESEYVGLGPNFLQRVEGVVEKDNTNPNDVVLASSLLFNNYKK